MVQTVEIVLGRMSAEAFAPFGQIIDEPAGPAASGAVESWHLGFEAEGAVELMLCRYRHEPYAFTTLERHLEVSQAFVPLGDAPSVMVVAPPTGAAAAPDPEAVRAFFVPGDLGLMLWRGTWHALTRFPVRPAGATFLMVTGRETQRELEAEQAGGTTPKLTQMVDCEARFGLAFRVVDPERLLGD